MVGVYYLSNCLKWKEKTNVLRSTLNFQYIAIDNSDILRLCTSIDSSS